MQSPYQNAVQAQTAYDAKLRANNLQNTQQVYSVIKRFGGIVARGATVLETSKLSTLIPSFSASSFASAVSAYTGTTVSAGEVDGSMSIRDVINLVNRKEIEAEVIANTPEPEPEEVTELQVLAAIKVAGGDNSATTVVDGTDTIDDWNGTANLAAVITALNTEFDVTLDATADSITLTTTITELTTLINEKLAA